ncbi:hypothetical protein SY88_13490 [Clostridiales bacterium PH28_bin88]|nr:hypothetical protein SY88_13490 [Clostridiales bacterium PH28_bin88]
MDGSTQLLSLVIFVIAVVLLITRPRELNEAIPTSIGALIFVALGIVSVGDIRKILPVISGASLTILSTIIMSFILESIGFFRWAAYQIINKAKGSGTRLFWYVSLLCFLMTILFNNDGSILITTPIIINIVFILGLPYRQKIPYLITGALVATASSAPIGVSNLANLICLKVINMGLTTQATIMLIPSLVGIITINLLLFLYFRRDIPRCIPTYETDIVRFRMVMQLLLYLGKNKLRKAASLSKSFDLKMFRASIVIVVLVRLSFFVLSYWKIPTEFIAVCGVLLLIGLRWYRTGNKPLDILLNIPWHIIVFAFSIYVLVIGLQNSGLTEFLNRIFSMITSAGDFRTILVSGLTMTLLSNICNNLPAVLIGTLSLTGMGLDAETIKLAYSAVIIGSDIGSLILPIGTLATLLWFFILKKYGIKLSWNRYISVTLRIIPIGLLVSLISLYLWTNWWTNWRVMP